MITKISLIDDEEEEKEERLFKISKIKPIETQLGIGAKAVGGATLPEVEETPPIGVSQRMRGIGEIPKYDKFEGPTIDYLETNKNAWATWFQELQTTPDKWKFLKGENWSPELKAISEEAKALGKKASELGVNPDDWIQTGVYAGFFTTLAIGIYPVISKLPANILNKIAFKVEGKTVKGQELLNALRRVRYPEAPGIGKPSIFDKKVFAKFVEEGGVKSLAQRMTKGVTITEVTPRFAFGTKLYAGLPADEIVKSIVEIGKVSADMVKGLDPVKVSQVTQSLLNTSPALANEFLKAVEKPEAIKETEKPIEKPIIPKALEPLAEEAILPLPKGAVLEQKDLREWRQLYIDEAKGIVDKDRLEKVKMAIIEWVEYLDDEIGNMTDVVYNEAFIEDLKEKTNKLENPKAGLKEIDTILSYIHSEGNILDYILKLAKKDYSNPEIIEGIQNELNAVRNLANQLKYRGTPTQATAGTKATEQKAEVELVAEKAIPEPAKAEVKTEIELASPAQINKSYSIAKSKAMISEEGKLKPQFRKIAEVMTGIKYIEKMTPEQAEMFIDQLSRLPEPKYKNGKLVAPSIPRTTKLTTQGFFQKKYGEPTPIWLLTDQTYYAEKLGIKPLVAPFEKGKQEFDLEFRRSSHLVDRMVVKLNKIAKTPGWERIKSKVKNIPTKAESKMAELLNKYEATPSGLSEKEADVFKYFRNLSKDIWRRENEVREKLDLPPIKYKQAYFRHTADAMAKEMLEGKYPFPQGIKYWSEKIVGKKIFNPMEFHRKLSDDLIDLWSKDIRAVTKAMLWNGLKEIHLGQPAKFLNEQLNAISKDLPEYKNLTPREQAAYDQTKVIPASTKKWLINYVNQVLKGQETEIDASLNRIVTKSGLKGIFDKVLSPFGRAVGRKPITNTFSLSGRAIISGVMGWVPRQIIRNSFQPVQNISLYGVKATIKAYLPASVDKNLKELMSESLFLKSYTGFEELPADLMGKLEKAWLTPYGIVAVNNAKLGMKAAYWNILELIKNPKFKKYGWADPQRTKDTPKGKLYPSEKEKLLKEMEFGASATQYQYIPMGMPGVFRYKALIPLTRLQSWWMNYFTKFNRESIHRGFKGRPSWSGEKGPTLPWSRRVNYLKYLVIGGAILTALGYKKSFMLGVAPTYLSPAGQLALGIYNYAITDTDWQKKKALRQIYYSWKAFIPGSLAWRDFISVWNGEKDLEEILFYGKKEEKKPEAITIGKPSISKISIPKINKIKINKISPGKIKF